MMIGRLALWTGALLVSRTHTIVTGMPLSPRVSGLLVYSVSDTTPRTVETRRKLKGDDEVAPYHHPLQQI